MFDQFLAGLSLVLSVSTLFYMLAGVAIGIVLGIVPGLGGITGMVILLPLTFGMDPASALAMILGMFAVINTSDSITSIMLGIPGTIASQATVIDGNAMAKRGLAQTAFGAAFASSAFGGVVGGMIMALSMPIALWIILAFGSPEFFLLSLLGLLMVGTVSGKAVSKGLGAAILGLMLSQIGYPVASSTPRYYFGQSELLNGLSLVPVILALFGLPEMMDLAARRSSIAHLADEHAKEDSIWSGVKAVIRNRWLMVRCSMLGVYIGMLPAIGSSVADWLAYGHASHSAKDSSEFGKGDVRGVIAPESCNNAVLGGSLIPTLAFGIPGSGLMAVFLGAMTIHGLSPGRNMLADHLDLTFSMVWTIVFANIVGAILLMIWGRQLARVAFIDGNFVVPAVIIFIFMGAWVWEPNMFTWWTLLGIGLLGYLLKITGWPRPPFILGFVLGPVLENSMALTWQSYTFTEVVTRPTVIALVLFVCGVFFFALRSTRRSLAEHSIEDTKDSRTSLIMSTGLALALFALFAAAVWMARDWKLLSRLSPMTFGIAGMLIMIFVILQDRVKLQHIAAARRGGDRSAGGSLAEFWADHKRQTLFFAAIAAMAALMPVLGTYAVFLIFACGYVALWGRFRWWVVALYTAGVGAVLYLLYDRLLHAAFELPFFM